MENIKKMGKNTSKSIYKAAWAEISVDGLEHNLRIIRSGLRPGAAVCAVLKADAYGHGAVAVSKEIEDTEYLWGYAVATDEEALILRHNGIKKPILVLGYTFKESYEDIVAHADSSADGSKAHHQADCHINQRYICHF